jgi:hypothetical protein
LVVDDIIMSYGTWQDLVAREVALGIYQGRVAQAAKRIAARALF